MNYPTEQYESYADCDDHFVRSSFPPDLKPFWTVNNISEATDKFYLKSTSELHNYFGNSLAKILRFFRKNSFLRFILWVKSLRLSVAMLENGGHCRGGDHYTVE